MRRGCLIAIVVVVVLLALVALALWALWVKLGRGAPVYQMIGWMCEDSQSYPAAARWYGKAVRAKPRDGQLRLRHGDALWQARDRHAALGEYTEGARLEPTWTWPLSRKACAEADLGDFAAAQQTTDQLRKLAPKDAYTLYCLGHLRAAQGKDAEAIRAFRDTIDLDANVTEAYAELGKLLEKRGSTDEAVKAYEEGARHGNDDCVQRLLALGRTVPPMTVPFAQAQPSTAPPSGMSSTSTSTGGAPPPAVGGMIAGFMVVYFIFWGVMMLLIMAGWVAQLLAIYDCARRDFPDPVTRAMWCLVLVLAQWIGALIYYIVIYRKGEPPIQPPR
jgi:hypothetical protein